MKLTEKATIGILEVKNRMVLAPMSRSRANADGTVKDMTVTYYQQRSTAGLIITEATSISEQGKGSLFTPGIYSDAHVEAWRKVTAAVHQAGSRIFMQLSHAGRIGHSIEKNGELPIAPSAVAIAGQRPTSQGLQPYETPRALETGEVRQVITDYIEAGKRAKEAGFDGVELHGAFGNLANQFLVDGANKRTDEYGGSIENRSRFVLEILTGLTNVWGAGKVGIKLSPSIPLNDMIDSDPVALYSYLITQCNALPLAYLHLVQPLIPIEQFPHWSKDVLKSFRHLSKHSVIANGGYQMEKAESTLFAGEADAISFGSLFLANPDLPQRFELNAQLNTPDRSSFYGGTEKGYIDYPALAA